MEHIPQENRRPGLDWLLKCRLWLRFSEFLICFGFEIGFFPIPVYRQNTAPYTLPLVSLHTHSTNSPLPTPLTRLSLSSLEASFLTLSICKIDRKNCLFSFSIHFWERNFVWIFTNPINLGWVFYFWGLGFCSVNLSRDIGWDIEFFLSPMYLREDETKAWDS